MRSDFKDSTDTINKMIQFGTVKYGIVKQLKDRTRSERDVTSDQEENGTSLPCSPLLDCKPSVSPEIRHHHHNLHQNQQTMFDHQNEDHNHNNNISENHDDDNHCTSSPIKLEHPIDTYPETDTNHRIPSPSILVQQEQQQKQQSQLESPKQQRSPSSNVINNHDEDHNMSDAEDDHRSIHSLSGTIHESNLEEKNQQKSHNLQLNQQHHNKNVENDHNNSIIENAIASNSEPNNSCSPPLTLSQLPQFPAGPMTLEAIQNMQMAVAQFAAKTLANGGNDNEAAMKQLAFLQQTLFNLQQQQLFQIQLIQQLQSQLAMNQMKDGDGEGDADGEQEEQNDEEDGIDDEDQNCSAENLSNQNSEKNDHHKDIITNESMDVECNENETSKKIEEEDNGEEEEDDEENKEVMKSLHQEQRKQHQKQVQQEEKLIKYDQEEQKQLKMNECNKIQKDNSHLPPLPKQDENTPLPYGSDLASSIITNHDDLPSLDEPNSLEMLQRRAQEVLESASQGILAGNLADEFAFGKDKNGDGKNRNEPFFKHRCRYCGKVFGSDSALQIHIRSHTGERPFKCNVCGSRFTTKGNLKVHFQRHAQKFPHVPMNATPIPEHLDKFHPPLLEQMSPDSSPTHQPQMPHPNVPVSLPLPFPPGAGFPGLPLYRPPLEILKSLGTPYPNPFFNPTMPPMPPKRDQEMPTDLRKPTTAPSSPKMKEIKEETKEESVSLRIKEEEENEPEVLVREKSVTPPLSPPSPPQPQQPTHQQPQSQQPPPPTPVTLPQPISPLVQLLPAPPQLPPSTSSLPSLPSLPSMPSMSSMSSMPSMPSMPSMLSMSSMPPIPPMPSMPQMSRDELSDRLPLNYTRSSPDRRSPIRSPASIPRSPFFGPLKHEMALLPRPHSNDNSWENFIEVSNTSETLKLKELMKNKKLTDPNQCVVCDRVLSCKSALQMHYRTHTGERPFKCRICGRAFTTKGNLKTHMAVHKIRPPMRNFHQCPVCHKKYSNALVLQQHIRLHTGEPTDLTPEQIQAAEIRDFPPSMMPGSFLHPFAFNFGMPGHNGNLGSESSQGDNDENMDCSDDFDDDMSDQLSNGGDSDRQKSGDEMKGMLFEQKLKIENNRPKSEASTSSAPTSPLSAMNKLSPAPSDTSQGALDLTPRSATSIPRPPPLNPALLPVRPPFGMFPNIPLFPPVSTTTHNMCSAMNSIAQSVMPSAPFNPLALSGVRGSTTCGICFKTFPCHSALEIHYRSHTKERPFKCTICDRGFTTKGNLKQHMLTHKIRDMEQDAYRNRAVKYMSGWKEGFE